MSGLPPTATEEPTIRFGGFVPQAESSVAASPACFILLEQRAGEKYDEPAAGPRSQPGSCEDLLASVGRTPGGPWYHVHGSAVDATAAAREYLLVWLRVLRHFAVDSHCRSGIRRFPLPAYHPCHDSRRTAFYPPPASVWS